MPSPAEQMGDPLYRLAREESFRAFIGALSPVLFDELVDYGKAATTVGESGVMIRDEVEGVYLRAKFTADTLTFGVGDGDLYEIPYTEAQELIHPEDKAA